MFQDKVNRTELESLGEFKVIDELTKDFKLNNKSSVKGIGDDCAVLSYNEKQILVTNDVLVEGIHFDLMYTPLMHLGYKSVVVNLSDIYAMNGRPKQIIVSMAISNRFSLEALQEIYSGIYQACKNYHVDLVGGDTTSSTSGLFISITAIGEADKDKIVYRNNAKENELICVSGNLGAAYMGILVLEREKAAWRGNPNLQPDLSGNEYVLQRFLRPEARFDIIEIFKAKNVIPTSMIDISDGLASELHHICKQSNCGCVIYEDKIPIDPATILCADGFNLNPVVAAMNGGEDYELLFTIKQSDYESIKDIPQISIIGHITEGDNLGLATNSGQLVPIVAQGWDSFKPRNNNNNENE